MSERQIVDIALLVGAIVGTVWVLTPALMFALGLTRFRILVSEDPKAAEPLGDDPNYELRYRQFLELGFRPVGTTIETCWFINPIKWYRRSIRPLRWLASSDGRFLASFHRLIPTEPVRFGIVTLLTDNGMVRTTCPGVGKQSLVENRLRVEMPNAEPKELFARHQEQVRAFCEQQGLAVRNANLRDAAAMEEINARFLLPRLGTKLYRVPASYFLFPALLVVGAASRIGLSRLDWRTWAVAACVGTAVFAVFRHITFPNLFRQAVQRQRTASR